VTDQPRAALASLMIQRDLSAPWTSVTVVERTGSTNADLLADGLDGAVLVAESQESGRGRLDRSWQSPPRAGLTFSVRFRPGTALGTWGWLPLLTGLAVRAAVATSVEAVLKWPNDVLIGPARRKVAGVLAQAVGDSVVVGIGLNVHQTSAELPIETATSLALEGVVADRAELLLAILDGLGSRIQAWQRAGGDAAACGLAAEYTAHCSTIGQEVTVTGLAEGARSGRAVGIDPEGRLLVLVNGVVQPIAAGDVEHVRPTQPNH
jgi:BirA family biotin operon repressor/biotin-[acetyl-CoA-carboxylase] ligase